MDGFRVKIQGEVNSLYSLKYIQIHHYIHYNKLEVDAPEMNDVALKV